MKGKILIVAAAVAAGAVLGAVKDDVHGYTPKGYVQPKEPEVLERLERMAVLGAWLKVNGEAIYETRPLEPYRADDWAFTRNRKTGAEFAIRLWKEGEAQSGYQTVPGIKAKKLLHVGSGQSFDCVNMGNGVSFDLPSDFKADANADVFRIVRRAERQ